MVINEMIFDFRSVLDEGLVIAVAGYVTVFFSLVVLYLVFNFLRRFYTFQVRKRLRRKGERGQPTKEELFIQGDIIAAISMAIYMYHELHDEESNIITIKRVSKAYSPWNSRAFGLRSFNKR
jgi:hypothetical protein